MTKAEDHVDWWLSSIRQPLIDNFNHGYKHGRDELAETLSGEQNAPVSANGGAKVYPDMGSNAESCVAALKTVEDVRNSRTTDGRISTTEDIQRGWAENEKTRVYEDG